MGEVHLKTTTEQAGAIQDISGRPIAENNFHQAISPDISTNKV
jgi:hypothetical protein